MSGCSHAQIRSNVTAFLRDWFPCCMPPCPCSVLSTEQPVADMCDCAPHSALHPLTFAVARPTPLTLSPLACLQATVAMAAIPTVAMAATPSVVVSLRAVPRLVLRPAATPLVEVHMGALAAALPPVLRPLPLLLAARSNNLALTWVIWAPAAELTACVLSVGMT